MDRQPQLLPCVIASSGSSEQRARTLTFARWSESLSSLGRHQSCTALDGPPPAMTKQFDCFLAHDWGTDELGRDNHSRVSEVCSRLRDAGFKPWFDNDEMRGDVNDTMMDGLDKSSCVIVFITERYIIKASGKGPNGLNDNCARRQAHIHLTHV